MTAAIRFSHVCKRYDLGLTRTSAPAVVMQWIKRGVGHESDSTRGRKSFWALNDVSFELKTGESLALIGPNGAGKSTILKLLARITRPTSGQAEVNGRLSALIELGAGFHPDLTGRENIYLNGTILGLSRGDITRRLDEIVAFSELEPFIDTPVKRYSSGMTVRLGFAVASCIEPDILLVDEVLAVGDASFRQKCIQRIKQLLDDGTSLVFVSHDMGLVKAVCDTGIYLEHGMVQEAGAIGAVIDTYNRALDKQRSSKLHVEDGSSAGLPSGVEITGVDFLDGDGSPTEVFVNGETAEMRIRYVAYHAIGKANALVRIYRSDGLSCCIMRTHLDRFPITLEHGEGTISLILDPMQLYAGTYYASVWIMNAEDADGIAQATSGWFEVRNRISGREAHDGVFEPMRSWRHDPYPVRLLEASPVAETAALA